MTTATATASTIEVVDQGRLSFSFEDMMRWARRASGAPARGRREHESCRLTTSLGKCTVPVGVDTRENDGHPRSDATEAPTTEAPPQVTPRPLDGDSVLPRLALSAFAAFVALAVKAAEGLDGLAAAAVRAWPPIRRLVTRSALVAARAIANGAVVLARCGWMTGCWSVRTARTYGPVLADRVVTVAQMFIGGARRRWPAVAAALRNGRITGARSGAVVLGHLDSAAERVGCRLRESLRQRAARWDSDELRPGVTASRLVGVLGRAVAIAAVLAATLVVGGRATVDAFVAAAVAGEAETITLPPLAERTEIFAADGSSLGLVRADHGNRVVVPLDAVPEVVVDAVVATEDADFWNHDGIDLSGIARATKRNVAAGGIEQGGSTITQQLAKSTLESPKRDLPRKLTEAVLAVRLDDQLGKRGVLERYLNTIYFGQGAYGIAAAAETYFGRPLAEVTVDQAALLAGLIRGPNLYDPVTFPEAARVRREAVLRRMVAEGHLSAADAEAAGGAALPTTINRRPAAIGWVADAARAELAADARLGDTPEVRIAAVAGGGLRVHTTIHPALQHQAQDALTAGVPGGTDLTAALVSLEPTTGAVRALVGGTDYSARQFNAAIDGAGRQTGSSFKVFALVAALRRGHVSTEQVDGSSPCTIPNPGGKPNPWMPENYEGEAFGQMSLVDATVQSSNCAYARLAATIGPEGVARTAREMGITASLQKVPSMTLGTNTVRPIEMAAAYATLAADGVVHTPHIVSRVERRDGTLVFANDGGRRRVIDSQVARVATSVLTEVVSRGTGRVAALGERPVAGKTGTAQNHQDAWFVGYTPQLATAVWMGDINGERPMVNVGGINVTGGSYPARIWQRFMVAAHAGLPVVGFPAPDPEPPATLTTAVVEADPAPAPAPPRSRGGKGLGKAKRY